MAKHIQSHDPDVFAPYEVEKASMALLAKEHDATKRDRFISDASDHCVLVFEVGF